MAVHTPSLLGLILQCRSDQKSPPVVLALGPFPQHGKMNKNQCIFFPLPLQYLMIYVVLHGKRGAKIKFINLWTFFKNRCLIWLEAPLWHNAHLLSCCSVLDEKKRQIDNATENVCFTEAATESDSVPLLAPSPHRGRG